MTDPTPGTRSGELAPRPTLEDLAARVRELEARVDELRRLADVFADELRVSVKAGGDEGRDELLAGHLGFVSRLRGEQA